MKSTVIESVAALAAGESAGQSEVSREDPATRPRTHWGALYAMLLASVGLCIGGGRLAAAVGHSTVIQYGVALAILGLFAAWVRSNRPALSSDVSEAHAQSRQPFSVIHVAFSPNRVGSDQHAFSAPPGASNGAGPIRPVARAPQR
jgi:hypothetical protein